MACGPVLRELRDAGFGLAIDDFGTGYSSLAYLKQLPATSIKVDQAFTAQLADRQDISVVMAILAIADTYGLNVVAEGIETAEQMEVLRSLGCQDGQGYHFARPMPAEEFSRPAATPAAHCPGAQCRGRPDRRPHRPGPTAVAAVVVTSSDAMANDPLRCQDHGQPPAGAGARRRVVGAPGPGRRAPVLVGPGLAGGPSAGFVGGTLLLGVTMWWAAEPLARHTLGGRPCDPVEHARLLNVVDGLCATIGAHQPEIRVRPGKRPQRRRVRPPPQERHARRHPGASGRAHPDRARGRHRPAADPHPLLRHAPGHGHGGHARDRGDHALAARAHNGHGPRRRQLHPLPARA